MDNVALHEADGGSLLRSTTRGVRRVSSGEAPLFAAPIRFPPEGAGPRLFYANPNGVREGFFVEVAVVLRLTKVDAIVWRALIRAGVLRPLAADRAEHYQIAAEALKQRGAPLVSEAAARVLGTSRSADDIWRPAPADKDEGKNFPGGYTGPYDPMPRGLFDKKPFLDRLAESSPEGGAFMLAEALFGGGPPNAEASQVMLMLGEIAMVQKAELPQFATPSGDAGQETAAAAAEVAAADVFSQMMDEFDAMGF
jgi:hypothetical protein